MLVKPIHKHEVKLFLGVRHEIRRVHLHHMEPFIVIGNQKTLAHRNHVRVDLHHGDVRVGQVLVAKLGERAAA